MCVCHLRAAEAKAGEFWGLNLDNQWNRLGKLKIQQEILSQNTGLGVGSHGI